MVRTSNTEPRPPRNANERSRRSGHRGAEAENPERHGAWLPAEL